MNTVHFGRKGALVLALTVLILSALPVDGHTLSGAERSVFRWVNGAPEVPYPIVWVFLQAGNVGAPVVAGAVAAVCRRRRLALVLPLTGVVTWLAAKGIKAVVGRGRPADVLAEVITRHAPESGLGWVSGHAAVAATIVTLSWCVLSRRWRLAALVVVVVLNLAKIYAGEHLPLDMVGGAAVGVVVGVLASRLAQARWGRNWCQPVSHRGVAT